VLATSLRYTVTYVVLPEARYDAVADFYEDSNADSYTASPEVELFELVGDVIGQQVLDLACGHGRITRELARRGARVTGLDLSAVLLERARAIEDQAPLGITYERGDVASPQIFREVTFDGVVCHFGLSDIDDLDGALATVARRLRPDGWFVFSILHPCFPGWGSDISASWAPGRGYDQEGWWASNAVHSRLRQQVGANHRMLSTYLNALTRHGLMLDSMIEPPTPDDWRSTAPEKDAVPVFLLARYHLATHSR